MALQTIRDGYIDTLRKNYDQQVEWRRNRIRQSSNDARQRNAPKPAMASGKFLWYVVAGLIAGIPLYLIAWFLRLKSSDMLIAGGAGFLFCIGMYFYRLITYTRRQRQIDELDRRTNEQLRWDLAAAERQFEAEYEDAVSSYRSSVAQTADRFYSEAQETGSLPPAASWLEDLLGTAIQAAPRSRSLEWISPQMTFTVHPAKITARLRPSPGITPDWDEETDREWAEKEYEYNFKNQQERSPITATDPDGRAVQCAAYASLLARVLRESVLEKYPLGPYDEEPGSSEVRVQTVVGGNSAALEYMAANREFVPIS